MLLFLPLSVTVKVTITSVTNGVTDVITQSHYNVKNTQKRLLC